MACACACACACARCVSPPPTQLRAGQPSRSSRLAMDHLECPRPLECPAGTSRGRATQRRIERVTSSKPASWPATARALFAVFGPPTRPRAASDPGRTARPVASRRETSRHEPARYGEIWGDMGRYLKARACVLGTPASGREDGLCAVSSEHRAKTRGHGYSDYSRVRAEHRRVRVLSSAGWYAPKVRTTSYSASRGHEPCGTTNGAKAERDPLAAATVAHASTTGERASG